MSKLKIYFFIGVTSTLISILVFQLFIIVSQSGEYLEVTFLDVGQGDAIFIDVPNGVQVLIDGGPDGSVLRSLGNVMKFHDKEIDIVMTTHSDLDHIGGIPEVLKRFDVEIYIVATSTKVTEVTEIIDNLADKTIVWVGDRIILDPDRNIYIDILFPDYSYQAKEVNDQSLISRLVYGEIEFLFTGDASKKVERYLISSYSEYLNADVLKVGHHGSKTSTSKEFLSAVSPEYSVISAGEDNKYGHPHGEVTNLLKEFDVEILETKDDSITFKTDGQTIFR